MKAGLERRQDRRLARLVAHLVVALLVVVQQTAWPAVITVDLGCTLVDAITAANTDTAVGLCAAGSGADEIQLTGNVSLTVVDNLNNGPSGLPSVTSEITVKGNDFTVERDTGASEFRIFHVVVGAILTLDNTTVAYGRVPAGYFGGGIFNDAGTLNLTHSTVSGNRAGRPYDYANGGGIFNDAGTLNLTNSTVSGNYANLGGGIFNNAGTATLTTSTVSDNGTGDAGGGIFNDAGIATLTTSTVSHNGAGGFYGGYGGGIVNRFGTLTLTNSTVSDNFATHGSFYAGSSAGGIFSNGTLTLTNSTLSGNSAGSSAGGIENGASSVSTLTNSLIANSIGGNCAGSIIDGGNNFADDTSCGTIPGTLTGLDPTLKDNVGPTMTHALLEGSIAIDAAGACALPEDQRGAMRVGPCDSGAYEFIPCNELLLADDTITTTVMLEACHTARLGPNFLVAFPGNLTVTAGAQVILQDGVSFGPDASVTLGIDPNLQLSP